MNAVHPFGLSRSSNVSLVTSTDEVMKTRFDDSWQLLGGLSTERWHHPELPELLGLLSTESKDHPERWKYSTGVLDRRGGWSG